MTDSIRLLVINPNSSDSVTSALRTSFDQSSPPGVTLSFWNPRSGPAGISDEQTARESTDACWDELIGEDDRVLGKGLEGYDGFLIACFSEHPLISALQAHLTRHSSRAKVLGMFHAAITHALLLGSKFGIITSGTGWEPALTKGVASFLGSPNSDRFVGVHSTGVGVVELREGDRQMVKQVMECGSKDLLVKGAGVIVLGCAAMSGMESWIKQAADGVAVVDGARAGVELLVGLARAGN
ncbi:Asp/Glu/hydantoin racemase [Phaffia rhodozyma]|uniref:Asp/Glu/hydantoin racemase n=1 Tax=Phaffia rhodozyma TaxID=264483 RepID=A0A0F7SLF8_PHARH|nr:Asp/Glu/hydantoin racemase [Phaffia rhodozyma]